MSRSPIRETLLHHWEQQARAARDTEALELIAAYRALRQRCSDQQVRIADLSRDRDALALEVRRLRTAGLRDPEAP